MTIGRVSSVGINPDLHRSSSDCATSRRGASRLMRSIEIGIDIEVVKVDPDFDDRQHKEAL
jgi:hypothetical protein